MKGEHTVGASTVGRGRYESCTLLTCSTNGCREQREKPAP